MPGMGGLELIERLGAMQSSLPVVIFAGYGEVAMAVRAMKAGAFDFLEKPIQPEELLRCIERALKFSEEHQDLIGRPPPGCFQNRKFDQSPARIVPSSSWPGPQARILPQTCKSASTPSTIIAPPLCGNLGQGPCRHDPHGARCHLAQNRSMSMPRLQHIPSERRGGLR